MLRLGHASSGKRLITVSSIGPTLPTFIQVANLRPRYVDIIGVIVPSSGKGSDKLVFSMLNRHPTADVDLPMEMRDFGKCSLEWTTSFSLKSIRSASGEASLMSRGRVSHGP